MATGGAGHRCRPSGGPAMTTWGQVLGGLVIFVVLVVLVVLLACAGWVGAQKYRESVEQRASFEAGRCRLVAIRYDAIYDSGHIVRDCPTVDGGTRKVTSPVTWKVLKEERSEEHTSELQSRLHLVCRLLLEKKKKE